MVRRLLVAALLVTGCSRGPALPVNTVLWRVGSWTQVAPQVRRAAARFISFRADGAYIEHVCYVIEQPDTSVYISRSDPHLITIGNWVRDGQEIVARRTIVARQNPYSGPSDPLCSEVRYTMSGNSVLGKDGPYSPVTRLVAPDFESYINDARRTGKPCPQPSR